MEEYCFFGKLLETGSHFFRQYFVTSAGIHGAIYKCTVYHAPTTVLHSQVNSFTMIFQPRFIPNMLTCSEPNKFILVSSDQRMCRKSKQGFCHPKKFMPCIVTDTPIHIDNPCAKSIFPLFNLPVSFSILLKPHNQIFSFL